MQQRAILLMYRSRQLRTYETAKSILAERYPNKKDKRSRPQTEN